MAAAIVLVVVLIGVAVMLRGDDTTTIDTVGPSGDTTAGELSEDGRLFEAARLAAVAANEMQIETELAVRFAASDGDPGARAAWEDQATSSDKAIEAMREQLRSIDVDTLDGVTQSAVSLIQRTSDSPRTARSIVGGGVTAWPATFEVYNHISGAFVEAGSRLANEVSDPELSDAALSWGVAVQIEADVADQRAMLTGVFSDDSFPAVDGDPPSAPSSYDSLLEIVNDEQVHVRALDDLGEPESAGVMRDALSGNEVSGADNLRQVALDGKEATGLGVDVEVWRNASAAKLDRVHDAQVTLADSVIDRAGERPTAAPAAAEGDQTQPVALIVAGALLAVLVLAGLAYVLGRRTARRQAG